MSSYFASDDEESQQSVEFKYKNLFYTEVHLSNSLNLLEDWKQNTKLSFLEYLRAQAPILKKQANLILSAYQVRIVAFCEAIVNSLKQIVEEYMKVFRKNEKVDEKMIFEIDQKLYQIAKYLHLAEINNWVDFFQDLFSDKVQDIYKYLRKSLYYSLDLYITWFVILTPKMFRKQQNQAIYKYSLSGNHSFYQKQITLAKRKYISHSKCFDQCSTTTQLLENMKQLINDDKIKEANKMKALFLIKGQFYNRVPAASLKQKFVRQSLRVYNCIQLSQSWDCSTYENLCLQILQRSQKEPELLQCLLFMEPQLVEFESRIRICELASMLNKILGEIIQLMQNQNIQNLNLPFLHQILDSHNIQLFLCLIINFQGSSKSIFSINNSELHKDFLEIIDKMKTIYLSFMSDTWICPISIANEVTIKFFLKVSSEDFTSEILAHVTQMVQNLATQKMPKMINIKKSQDNSFSVCYSEPSRIQYLSIIYSYLDDYLSKFPEQYIDLPQIYPTDLTTAILFVRSLELKLKHHNPSNQQTKNNYKQILDNCTQNHKIGTKFNWYKRTDFDCSVEDRQMEFSFQKSVSATWARQILQELFNNRDTEKNQGFIRSCNNGDLTHERIFNYLKYAVGMTFSASRYNSVDEQKLFGMLEEMNIQLSVNYGDIFNLQMQDEVAMNYLHLLLMFYNVKIQEATGSQIYSLIAHKIVFPWLRTEFKTGQIFKNKFKQFFMYHNLLTEYVMIGDIIINQIASHESDGEFYKNIENKVQYFCDAPSKVLEQVLLEQKEELLTKVLSLFSPQLHITLFMPVCQIFIYILERSPQLTDQFSLDYAVDFIMEEEKLMKIFQHLNEGSDASKHLRKSLAAKMPEYLQNLSIVNAGKLFKIYYEQVQSVEKDLAVFEKIPESLDKIQVVFIKSILAFIYLSSEDNLQQQKKAKFMKTLLALKQTTENWKDKERVFLESVIPGEVAQKIKGVYEHLKNIDVELVQEKMKEWFAKFWCETVVLKCGTFEDTVNYEQDSLKYLKEVSKGSEMEVGIQIIKENKIKYNYFKKIINKLPILQKSAEEAIKSIQNPNPQLISKLILINSKYHSQLLEHYILQKLQIFSGLIPIKIFQPYLIRQIKRELEAVPEDFIQEIFYGEAGEQKNYQSIEKVNEVFYKILCLPLKKFQKMELDENKIVVESEVNIRKSDKDRSKKKKGRGSKGKKKLTRDGKVEQEIEEWQTESESESDESDFVSISDNQSEKSKKTKYEAAEEILQELKNGDLDSSQSQSVSYEDAEKPEIAQMFYSDDNTNFMYYKRYISLREEVDLIVDSNYSHSLDSFKSDPQFQAKVVEIVKILGLIPPSIVSEILIKIPQNLIVCLKFYGLSEEVLENKRNSQRKPQTKLPAFEDEGGDYVSQRNQDSSEDYEGDSQDDFQEEEEELEGDQLEGDSQNDSNQSQKRKKQDTEEEDFTIELPDLKQINSKIEIEITGDEFTKEELIKIMSIAVFKLFSFSSSERQLKSVISFYNEIFDSDFIKIFIDTAITVFRVDENYSRKNKHEFNKKINALGLSIRKAVDSFLTFIEQNNNTEMRIQKYLIQPCQSLLPIGSKVIIDSNLKMRDNRLILFILLSKLKQTSTFEKLKSYLVKLGDLKPFRFKKSDCKILTKHIYQNEASTSIFKFIDETLSMDSVDRDIQLYCCISVYGKMMRNQIAQTIKIDMLQENDKDVPQKYRQKIAQNLMRVFAKKIKHYYFWSKRCLVQVNSSGDNFIKFLRNKDLIQLTEMMIYYIRAMKIKFQNQIDSKSFNKIISFPQKIIKISCIYLHYLKPKLQMENWKTLKIVKQFFNAFSYSQYPFSRLEQVFNLIIELADLEIFSGPKYKQVFIPFLIKNPQVSKELSLMFKAPKVPEEADGQRVYVTRECSFDMTLYQLKKKSLLVEYHEEDGSDYGGMVRQLMMGWKGVGIGEEGLFIGKILGISFKNSIPYGGDFDLPMAIAITNYKIDLDFIKQHDKLVYDSLNFIKENDLQDLQLKFTIIRQKFGKIYSYPLKENGEQIQVTQNNKEQYLKLYIQKYYSIGREWELEEIKNGFYSIVYKKYAEIFHPVELIQKIRGEEVTDYMKLKKKAKYEQGYTENSPVVKWFWEIISNFNQEEMNKFIQFLSGAPKVSLYDPYFSFTIEKTYEDDEQKLPVAHTCFNTLDLPEYSTKEILQKKLRQAIYQGNQNFGIL